MVCVATAVLAACGPSERAFMAACDLSCYHAVVQCGFTLVPEGSSCSAMCRNDWRNLEGQSTDCAWFTVDLYECMAETSCARLAEGGSCTRQMANIQAACDW